MICLGVILFASIFLGTLCASQTCMSVSFTKLGNFFFSLFFQVDLQFLALFSSPSGTPMIQMLECLKLSQRLLILSSFLKVLFSSCSDWLFFASLCSKSLIWFSASSPLLLFPCKFFFISIRVSFVYGWIIFMLLRSSLSSLSILVTSVLNSASDRLLISILFSSFGGALIYSFIWAMFLCSFWQPSCVCVFVLWGAAITPYLGSMAWCSRCPIGPSGTASPITQAA